MNTLRTSERQGQRHSLARLLGAGWMAGGLLLSACHAGSHASKSEPGLNPLPPASAQPFVSGGQGNTLPASPAVLNFDPQPSELTPGQDGWSVGDCRYPDGWAQASITPVPETRYHGAMIVGLIDLNKQSQRPSVDSTTTTEDGPLIEDGVRAAVHDNGAFTLEPLRGATVNLSAAEAQKPHTFLTSEGHVVRTEHDSRTGRPFDVQVTIYCGFLGAV